LSHLQLSVIIPTYNEVNTIESVLDAVQAVMPQVSKEIVIVDDGSTDGTREWLKTFWEQHSRKKTVGYQTGDRPDCKEDHQTDCQTEPQTTINVIFQPSNQGKGAALREGFRQATGDVIVIQDADLEYDPQDWQEMWRLIEADRADVVYGSRFYGKPHRVLYFHHFLGNKVISMLVNLVCNTMFSDIEVCYKMFRREVVDGLVLTCDGFGFEVEFTMKIARYRRRWRFYEVGVSYYGRTYAEGKKISWRDGVRALWLIVWFTVRR